jgi:hypothetical protein
LGVSFHHVVRDGPGAAVNHNCRELSQSVKPSSDAQILTEEEIRFWLLPF